VVCQVADQSAAILELLKHKQISIGTKLEVKRKYEFDNSLEIKIRQTLPFTISEQVAKNIFVQIS
jgi:DtxR family Mn-dependent transcriptional regulator